MTDFNDLLKKQIRAIQIKELIPEDQLTKISTMTKHIVEAQKFLNPLGPIIEQLNQYHCNFANSLKPMFEEIFAEQNHLAEVIKSIFALSKTFDPMVEDFLKRLEEFNRELHEKHEQDMVFLPPFFNDLTLPQIRELLLETDRPLIEVYHDIFSDKENLNKLKKNWRDTPRFNEDRMVILNDALDAHLEKKFTLSIPILMTQLEGLLLETFEIDQGQISWAVRKSFPKEKNATYLSHVTGAYVIQDILLSEIFNSNKKDGYGPKGIYPNRPTIQHGVNTSYYKNPHASTRLIMLIDFIGSDDFDKYSKKFRESKIKEV